MPHCIHKFDKKKIKVFNIYFIRKNYYQENYLNFSIPHLYKKSEKIFLKEILFSKGKTKFRKSEKVAYKK